MLEELNGGNGPDFFAADTVADGVPGAVTIGAIFDFEEGSVLEFASEESAVEIQLETVPASFLNDNDGKTLPVSFLGPNNPTGIRNLIGVEGGERSVDTVDGAVEFVPTEVEFSRGDCNDDSKLDIADGIFLLYYFYLERPIPSCLAACNTNGNGKLGLSDSVYLFAYQFSEGPPPAAPFPCCGAGALPSDEGSCESFDSCD